MRLIVCFVVLVAVALTSSPSLAEEDNLGPSLTEFHMSGLVEDDRIKLTGYVFLGGQDARPVDLKAFKIERVSASGEAQSFVLTPVLAAGIKDSPYERRFTWVDTTAITGNTYRYVGTYQADVCLSTCPVVLTQPLAGPPTLAHEDRKR